MAQLLSTSNIIVIISGPITAITSVYLSNKVSDYKQTKRLFNSLLMETRHNREICEHYVENGENERLNNLGHNFEFSAYDIFTSNGSALTLNSITRDKLRSTYTGLRNMDRLAQPGAAPNNPRQAYETIKEIKERAEEVEDKLESHIQKYGYSSFSKFVLKGTYHKIRIKYRIMEFKIRNRNSNSDLKI